MDPHSELNAKTNNLAIQYLLVRGQDLERTFEMAHNDERVVAVGTAVSADIRLERPGVSPIHFYFERRACDIWIVPAYCVSELRVNAARITSPRKLGRRSIIEFGTAQIVAEVSQIPPVSRSAPRSIRSESVMSRMPYLTQLPDTNAPTRQPWMTEGLRSDPALAPSTIPLKVPKPGITNSRLRIVSCSQLIDDPCSALGMTLPVRPKPLAKSKIVDVAPLNKTLVGVAPLLVTVEESKKCARGIRCAEAKLPSGSRIPSQVATLFGRPSIGNLTRRRTDCLTRLGRLAKRYPIRACLAAIAIALAGSGAVVFSIRFFLLTERQAGVGQPLEITDRD